MGHISTRQHAPLLDEWVSTVGLAKREYGTHSWWASIYHMNQGPVPASRSGVTNGSSVSGSHQCAGLAAINRNTTISPRNAGHPKANHMHIVRR